MKQQYQYCRYCDHVFPAETETAICPGCHVAGYAQPADPLTSAILNTGTIVVTADNAKLCSTAGGEWVVYSASYPYRTLYQGRNLGKAVEALKEGKAQ